MARVALAMIALLMLPSMRMGIIAGAVGPVRVDRTVQGSIIGTPPPPVSLMTVEFTDAAHGFLATRTGTCPGKRCAIALLGTANAGPSLPSPAPILAGVAFDHPGHVYVADIKNGHIYVLSQSLQLLSVWTVPRPSGPYAVHLLGLAVGRHGATYATDLSDRIFKLTPQGAVQATWGSPGSLPGEFRQPWGIAAGTAGNLLVADNYNHRVQVLSPAGKPLAQWQLYSPHDLPGGPCGLQYLAIGPHGQVYVTDDCYGRVFKLSPTGKVLQIWGQKGHGSGQFSGIAGVAVGPRGNVFVGEALRILKFAPDGRLLGSFRKSGYPGYPFSPAGIAADSHGMIYVADAENYRVFKLSPSGRTLAVRCLRRAGCRGSYASRRRAVATP